MSEYLAKIDVSAWYGWALTADGWISLLTLTFLEIVLGIDNLVFLTIASQRLPEDPVMIIANIIAIAVMLAAADPIGHFIEKHPTVKMLALAFILLVGVALIADGLHIHIPRGFIYFAIAFSLTVETLNILARARRDRRRG